MVKWKFTFSKTRFAMHVHSRPITNTKQYSHTCIPVCMSNDPDLRATTLEFSRLFWFHFVHSPTLSSKPTNIQRFTRAIQYIKIYVKLENPAGHMRSHVSTGV